MNLQLTEQEQKAIEGLDFNSLQALESKTMIWLEKRRGRFTASEFHRLMTYENKPDELPKGGQTYALEKAVEALTDESDPGFNNEAMEYGKENEIEAVERFMDITGLQVTRYGNDQEFEELGKHVGATPDGRIDPMCGIEGKCPNSKTHFFYLTNIKNADDLKKHCNNYYWQIMGAMYVCDATSWYWFSYDKRFRNPHHRMHIIKVERNEVEIDFLKLRLRLGISYKNEMIRLLENQ